MGEQQRPLLDPDFGVHVPLSVRPETYNTFSSFPSDTAALFFPLSYPLLARTRLADFAVDFEERQPALFHGLASTASLELATLFHDLRQLALDAVNFGRMLGS